MHDYRTDLLPGFEFHQFGQGRLRQLPQQVGHEWTEQVCQVSISGCLDFLEQGINMTPYISGARRHKCDNGSLA